MSEHTPLAEEPHLPACVNCGSTSGPWVPTGGRWPSGAQKLGCAGCTTVEPEHTPMTLARLAEIAARTDVPALLAEVERLRAAHRAVLDLCDRAERGAGRWESPLPPPEWVAEVRDAATGPADAPPGAPDPIPLRWGLDDVMDDVMYGDDDSVTLLLSGPDLEPYVLELDAETAAALRAALAGPAGDTSRAEVLREAQDATVAWLTKRAREERAVAMQEEKRRATARARERRERAELISTLASKVARGAVREFLDAAPPAPSRAEVLNEAAALVRSYAPPAPEGEEEEAIAYALELAAGAVERGQR